MNIEIVNESIQTVKLLPSAKLNLLETGPNFYLQRLIFWSYAISLYDAIARWKLHCYHGNYYNCYHYQCEQFHDGGRYHIEISPLICGLVSI